VALNPGLARARAGAQRRWRSASAGARTLPDVVILGTQRGGTTSLFNWLAGHRGVAPSTTKEVHYFDRHYARGERWYRTHFPLRLDRRLAIEATPYLLFHPLAPQRVARDLPSTTRFIVLLREPGQRAISHYWHSVRIKAEEEPLVRALSLEDQRLAGTEEIVAAGGESFAHRNFSYRARGHYAEQLRRWFALIDRDRFLIVRSEDLFDDRGGPARVVQWLGLSPLDTPFPATNDAPRADTEGDAVTEELRRHFGPSNDDLFDLLGTRLWDR
jgi:hypothetical protein